MATGKDFVAYIAEQAQLGNSLTFKKMFGEYAVYLDGKLIGLVCDNSLFVKATEATTEIAQVLPQRPPYPGAKPHAVADELLDDADALRAFLVETAQGLPLPKIKKLKPSADRRGI